MSELHIVAEMMDNFTRTENAAYFEESIFYRKHIKQLADRVGELEYANMQLTRSVANLASEVDFQADVNDALQQHVYVLETSILECDNHQELVVESRNVRRRLEFENVNV